MLTLRRAHERGHADHGWLQSAHSFSFADYHDPAWMGWGNLRVINDDRIGPGTGFGMHGHRDMEIVTCVLQGALAHQDSMGNAATMVPGDVQRMSAGSGVRHSEANPAAHAGTHLLQIWIEPNVRGVPPSYEQTHFARADKRGRLRLVASPDGADGSVTLHADARLYAGLFSGAEAAELALDPARKAFVHVVKGALTVNGQRLTTGDALAMAGETWLRVGEGEGEGADDAGGAASSAGAEVLVFDLAA